MEGCADRKSTTEHTEKTTENTEKERGYLSRRSPAGRFVRVIAKFLARKAAVSSEFGFDMSQALEPPPSQRPPSSALPEKTFISLTINGSVIKLAVAPWTTLLDLLREYLDLTGTKKGCDHGQCGSCTVLLDGKRVNSCLTLAIMKDGAEVTTIEGIAQGDALHPLQQAFIDCDAFQCGYCTPGQICSAIGMIKEGHAKTTDDIRELMSGNLCRCGAYPNIVAAIEQTLRAGRNGSAAVSAY